jgi:hypothetical protein
MVDWESEFKKYIVEKFKDKLGFEISPASIKGLYVNTNIDLSLLEINDLAIVYAFAIMREDFEQAKRITDELAIRDCTISIDTDDLKKTGVINVYKKPETKTAYIDVKMKVLPDGMMIDFEKQNF